MFTNKFCLLPGITLLTLANAHPTNQKIWGRDTAGPPSTELLDMQLQTYESLNFTADDSVKWLDSWITSKIANFSGGNFIEAFTDSITPLIPSLGPGQKYNFKCSIENPCHTEGYPAAPTFDARMAWSILVAFQNLNAHYSAQHNFFYAVGTKFQASYADSLWNALKEDEGEVKYPALLPSMYSGAKDALKIIEKFYEDYYVAKFAGTALKDLAKFIPVLDLGLNIAAGIIGSSAIAPDVGSASLKMTFDSYMNKQQDVVERSFGKILSSNPRDAVSGFLTLLQKQPDVYLGSAPDFGPLKSQTESRSSSTTFSGTAAKARDTGLKNLGRAFVNTYYSTTGQVFQLITDDQWNEPQKQCLGSGILYDPVCIWDMNWGGFGIGLAPKTYDNSFNFYVSQEGIAFKILKKPIFSDAPFFITPEQALRGSMGCQLARQKAGKWNGDLVSALQRWSLAQDDRLWNMGRSDKASGRLVYTPDLNGDDECAWAVPIIGPLTNVPQNSVDFTGQKLIRHSKENFRLNYLRGYNQA